MWNFSLFPFKMITHTNFLMALGHLNLHKWTLSIFVVSRKAAWAQTPLNNGLLS